MADKCVLITGSSGLIGRAICHRLGSSGMRVIGFDREGPPYPPPNTDCIFVDLTSDESMQNALHIVEERYGTRLECVIHLAAYYSFSGSHPEMYHKLTVEGTERLIRGLERFEVNQFIFSSTMLVHAPTHSGQKINEESPVEGTWEYPMSKIQTEKLIKESHGDVPTVILRIAGVYTDICQSIPLAHQIQRIYEKQLTSHLYPGDTSVKQSFVHLDDLVDAVELSMKKRDQLGPYAVFLIGEEDTMSYDEIQQDVGHLLYGTDWNTMYVPKPVAKAGAWLQEVVPFGEEPFIRPWMADRADDNYDVIITRAARMLGWEPAHSLRDTLPRMVEGLKIDPHRWYELNKLETPHFLRHEHHKRKSA